MKKVIHIVLGGNHSKSKPGLRKMVEALALAQANTGLDVSIWKIGGHEDESLHLPDSKSFPLKVNRLKLSESLKEAVENLGEETIIHAHDGFVPEFFALSRKLRKARVKHRMVLSPHGSYSELNFRRLSPLKKVYYYLFERPVVKNASMIHLVGPAEVSGYNFFMDKVTPFISLPNGLPDIDVNESMNRENLITDKFIIIYSGNLQTYVKGLDILVQAFAAFSKEVFSEVELWMIGKGKEEDENDLKYAVKKLGIENQVKFYGDVDKQHRRSLLLKSHVFVQPSRLDCIPVTALEAASLGLPLIVSEETNLGGLVRQYEAGWFLSRNNVKNLTLAFHDAYFMYQTDEATYLKRNHNSYRMLREELTWKSLARKWKEVYSGIS